MLQMKIIFGRIPVLHTKKLIVCSSCLDYVNRCISCFSPPPLTKFYIINIFWQTASNTRLSSAFYSVYSKMNNFVVLVFFAVCGLASCLPDGDTYTSKFDSIFQDTDNLKNPRLLKKYVDCLLDDKTTCPKEAEELKGRHFVFITSW